MKIENSASNSTVIKAVPMNSNNSENKRILSSLNSESDSAKKEQSLFNLNIPGSRPRTFTDALRPILYSKPFNNQSLWAEADKERALVKTRDGYTISFLGQREEWHIRSPNGKATRIWGDPHVVESDGDKWDFSKQSSFTFGENKITVETTARGNRGAAVTKSVSIYNGKDRITVSDIDINKPRLDSWAFDADKSDSALADGTVYDLGIEENGDDEWVRR